MNKFILDFDKLKENHITSEEFLILSEIYNDTFNYYEDGRSDQIYWLDRLQVDGYIKIIESPSILVILREKGKQLIESFIYKPEIKSDIVEKTWNYIDSIKPKDEFTEFINKYRNIWKGLKVGSQGNAKSCSEKMQRWMKENPNYSQDDILKAAESYINSVDDIRFIQRADYFIYKKDKYGESSRLSDFIDEDEVKQGGWSSTLR